MSYTENSNPQLFAKPQLEPVHFAAVGFVIVAAQMQQTMKNQLLNLGFES